MNTLLYTPLKTPEDSTAPQESVHSEAKDSLPRHIWASVAATAILGIICCVIYPLVVWGIAQVLFPWQANGSLIKKDGTHTTVDSDAAGSTLLGQNFAAPAYFHPRPSAAGRGYDATSSGGSNFGPTSDKFLNGATTTQPAAAPATQPTESLAYDGVRLRTLHYALDNGITFKLYTVQYAANGEITARTEVPLSKFQDAKGTLNDIALVDAFPHANDPPDKLPLIAADFSTSIPADAVTASASGVDPHISLENALLQKPRVAAARHLSQGSVQNLIDQSTDRPKFGLLGDPGVNVLLLNIALDKAAPLRAATDTFSQSQHGFR